MYSGQTGPNLNLLWVARESMSDESMKKYWKKGKM